MNLIKKTALLFLLLANATSQSYADIGDDDFSEVEIRVIRPRYFTKSMRFELALNTAVITNQSFIYTYMISGVLAFHFSERFAAELDYAYGVSVDKTDKSNLDDTFSIKTEVTRTQQMTHLGLLWTPIYGKFQSESGYLLYSDTYFSVGGGQTGLLYKYDHCGSLRDLGDTATDDSRTTDNPAVYKYPSFYFGMGQRFFVSRSSSFKWDMRYYDIRRNKSDGFCYSGGAAESEDVPNIVVKLGFSQFL